MSRESARQQFNKYAAKLLFQYRFNDDKPGSYRTVEERIIVKFARSSAAAYDLFKKIGKNGEGFFKNDDGKLVCLEFIGIIDMVHLGIECGDDEVWYDIKRMKDPMERRDILIPIKSKLSAFIYEERIKMGRK